MGIWQVAPCILCHNIREKLRNWELLSWSVNSVPFIEPPGSLRCAQQPSTWPYPELVKSNPDPLILMSWTITTLSSHLHLHLDSKVVSFLQAFKYNFVCLLHFCHKWCITHKLNQQQCTNSISQLSDKTPSCLEEIWWHFSEFLHPRWEQPLHSHLQESKT